MNYKNERSIVVDGKEYVVKKSDKFEALKGIVSDSLYKYIIEIEDSMNLDFQNIIDELNYEIRQLNGEED